jgi:hypothetical protein
MKNIKKSKFSEISAPALSSAPNFFERTASPMRSAPPIFASTAQPLRSEKNLADFEPCPRPPALTRNESGFPTLYQ